MPEFSKLLKFSTKKNRPQISEKSRLKTSFSTRLSLAEPELAVDNAQPAFGGQKPAPRKPIPAGDGPLKKIIVIIARQNQNGCADELSARKVVVFLCLFLPSVTEREKERARESKLSLSSPAHAHVCVRVFSVQKHAAKFRPLGLSYCLLSLSK